MEYVHEDFHEQLAVLAVLLMRAHGNRIVVTRQDIHDAREHMAEHDIDMVTHQGSRLFDEVVIEFRHRSRGVVAGEVV